MANTGLVSLTYIQKISEKVRPRCSAAVARTSGGPAGDAVAGRGMKICLHFRPSPRAPAAHTLPANPLLPGPSPACCVRAPASSHLPKVSLASDFMWNLNSREASASFGYDYILRQCRLRGRIDTGALCGLAVARLALSLC